ncbi:MAG: (2Fe-2S)-binding protein [Chlorobi bacterium]|nr:(2Fe-2S)-binding protein [Chlorobiota bacterium]
MIIYINDKPCEAETGSLLLHAAQHNNAHIGCICGGNGICQSCFVYVKEGAELLSPPSEEEKAFISDKLFQEGGRLACQTVITGEGTIRVLTRAENLRRIVLGLNVPGFITYAQTIGYNVVTKLPNGAANLVSRVREGRLNPVDSIGKIGGGLRYGAGLAVHTVMETLPVLQAPVSLVSGVLQGPVSFISGALQAPVSLISGAASGIVNAASGLLCTISGGRITLPGTTCQSGTAQQTKAVENVTITVK